MAVKTTRSSLLNVTLMAGAILLVTGTTITNTVTTAYAGAHLVNPVYWEEEY